MSYTKSCLRTHQSPVYVSCNSKWTPLTAQDWICFLIFPLHICFQSAWPVHPTPSPCDLVFLPAWQLACHVWDLVLSWSIFPWMRLKSEISWKILWPAEIQGVSWTMPQITLFFFFFTCSCFCYIGGGTPVFWNIIQNVCVSPEVSLYFYPLQRYADSSGGNRYIFS